MEQVTGTVLKKAFLDLQQAQKEAGKTPQQWKEVAADLSVTGGAISNAVNDNPYQQKLRDRIAVYLEHLLGKPLFAGRTHKNRMYSKNLTTRQS